MLHVVLYEPEIPPNTGNIIRLCANTGVVLHLIHPLGFQMDDRGLKRAGLDYHEWASVKEHENFQSFVNNIKPTRVFACTTKAKQNYADVTYTKNDAFLFGPESRGLPKEILDRFLDTNKIRIPMRPESRSLNLSNATSIILYEALRQLKFDGCV